MAAIKMDDIELLTCPFCGGPGIFFHNDNSDYENQWYWTIHCNNCEVEMFGPYEKATEEDVAKAWNTRVDYCNA